eukprot:TRINITY_DN5223_c0_g1_i1.p2 TRINITY_DN5223_c0_g1~~TRINITY_DN5223_c0_g1_i1.p2  ORF type:complete len:299 (-),score=76.12 TRINITY_DN5223_c0_g1_i1:986-1882(-)
MRRRARAWLVLLGVCCCAAASERAPRCVQRGDCRSHDWRVGARADNLGEHTVLLAVNQRTQRLHDLAAQLSSSPESSHAHPLAAERWGRSDHFLTLNEVRALTADLDAEQAAFQWLNANGFRSITHSVLGFVQATHSVAAVERLFRTELYEFTSLEAHASIQRGFAYTMPLALAPYVEFVAGIVNFPQTRRTALVLPAEPRGHTDPLLLQSVYKITDHVVAHPDATQSVFEALKQSFSPDDLNQFLATHNMSAQTVAEVIGPNDPSIVCFMPKPEVLHPRSAKSSPTTVSKQISMCST